MKFIDSAESAISDIIPDGVDGVDVSEVIGTKKKRLVKSIFRLKQLRFDKNYDRRIFLENILGGPKKAYEIFSNPTRKNLAKLAEAEQMFETKMRDASAVENLVSLKVGDNSYITYNKNNGLKLEK
jgi:hypothetical protein